LKHVFVIHSVLTKIVADSVIRHFQLQREDCVQIVLRGQKRLEGIGVVTAEELPWLDEWESMPVGEFRRQVSSFIGAKGLSDGFFAYIPHLKMLHSSLLLGVPYCLGHYYLEEGSLSYYPMGSKGSDIARRRGLTGKLESNKGYFRRRFATKLRRYKLYRRFRNALWMEPEFLSEQKCNYRGAFGISNESFPGAPNVTTLQVEWRRYCGDLPDKHVHTLIVFDAAVEYGILDRNEYIPRFQAYLNQYARESEDVVYYKLHPEQAHDPFQAGLVSTVGAVRLPSECCLEALILRDHPIVVYWLSSVGDFAERAGVETVCLGRNEARANEILANG